MKSIFSSCVTKKWVERSWKWRSCMSKKHEKTQGKPMIVKNRLREKVKMSKKCCFSTGARGSKMLQKTIWNQDFRRAWPKNELRDHENEDHVRAKNIGKPNENQWFLKIAHERKRQSLKKNCFSRGAYGSKMLKKQFEIKICVLSAWKKHSSNKFKPRAHQDIKFTKKLENV